MIEVEAIREFDDYQGNLCQSPFPFISRIEHETWEVSVERANYLVQLGLVKIKGVKYINNR